MGFVRIFVFEHIRISAIQTPLAMTRHEISECYETCDIIADKRDERKEYPFLMLTI